jgi:hypothetical protein
MAESARAHETAPNTSKLARPGSVVGYIRPVFETFTEDDLNKSAFPAPVFEFVGWIRVRQSRYLTSARYIE